MILKIHLRFDFTFILHFTFYILHLRSGGTQSKSYGLGRAGFPPQLPPVADEAVSHQTRVQSFSKEFEYTPLPDCHLVRTVILSPPRNIHPGQPRCFPLQSNRLLASFAKNISRSNRFFTMAIAKMRGSPIRIYHSRQATLHTALGTIVPGFRPGNPLNISQDYPPYAPQYRFTPDSYGISFGNANTPQDSPAQEQVSTKTGSGSPCHWRSP